MKYHYYLLLITICIISCKKKNTEIQPDPKKLVVENYASIVFASYEDSYTKAVDLKASAQNFLASPSAQKLEAVKAAWLAARVPYEQTEAYRFYGGPIDDESTGPEGLLNSWPMDEAFIDYVEGDAKAGIINNPTTYPNITVSLLDSLNTLDGETEVSSGYHAIEFLLWGQDFSENGPGNRPFTDYVVGASGTASNQLRRGKYLEAAIDLLIQNLSTLIEAWKPGVANYRQTFVNDPQNSLVHIFTGMGSLAKGELAGERMTVALGTHEQEEEHSCFSDNTVNDIILCQKSITNVYKGTYTRNDGTLLDGPGIDELVNANNKDLNSAMISKLDLATEAVNKIPNPFDQAIRSGNPGEQKVLTAANAIKAEADKLVEVANALVIQLFLQ